MARGYSPAEELMKEVIARAMIPQLKASGFRKTALNFHRRRGETVQVVNVQVSHGSTAMEKTFYINVGIAFDAIGRLTGRPVPDRPKEYECDILGMRDRLEHLVSRLPPWWKVAVSDDPGAIADPLRAAIERLVTELDRIDGIAAYRAHRWFKIDGTPGFHVQVRYLLGDLDGAWRKVEELVAAGAGHEYASQPEWWVDRLGLAELRPRLGGKVG